MSDPRGPSGPNQWGQQPPSQWGQQPPPGGQQPPSQWGQQPPAGGPPPGWGQQPPQGWGQQPPSQWGQQPPSQWAQQPPSQWGQQPPPGGPPPGWGQQPPPGWGQQPPQGGPPPGWGQQPPPGPWDQPPGPWGQQPPFGAPSGWGEPAFSSSTYPVDVTFRDDADIGHLWGIPVLGHMIRYLVLIPSLIVLALVAIVAWLLSLFTWIPVLLLGRYPSWGYHWVGGALRWWTRAIAWFWLLSGSYPAFTLADEHGQHVQVPIPEDQRINRFWGIPILGYMVRGLILIPHLFVLWILGIASAFLLLFAWIPVLLLGRQAAVVYTVVGGYLRWYVRVAAYFLMMTDRYPPFSLEA